MRSNLTNLSFVLPGLHLNIVEIEKILQLWEKKKKNSRHVVPAQEIKKLNSRERNSDKSDQRCIRFDVFRSAFEHFGTVKWNSSHLACQMTWANPWAVPFSSFLFFSFCFLLLPSTTLSSVRGKFSVTFLSPPRHVAFR